MLRAERLESRLTLCADPMHPLAQEGFIATSAGVQGGFLNFSTDTVQSTSTGTRLSLGGTMAAAANGLPELHGLPGAPTAIYLDFDGHAASNLGAYDVDGDPTTFNAAEAATIAEAHRGVSVFFAMFDVNVTTVKPTVPFAWIVISNDITGGTSNVGVFPNTEPRSWISSSSAETRITGIVHELGHNFGLWHQSDYDLQGNLTSEYSNGTDALHGALMGVDYRRDVQKWFLGHPSRSASELQDDVKVIADAIKKYQPAGGDGFRADDYGGTIATATAMAATGGSRTIAGNIERLTDVDTFSFTTGGGGAVISVVPTKPSGLDAKVEVFDAAGVLVAASDADTNEQQIVMPVGTGTWYVSVSSHGNYGDLGTYDLTVNDLPAGWASADVGATGLVGDAGFGGDTFTVDGSGAAVGGTADAFRFAWQRLTGDGSIVARVTGNPGPNGGAKAGVEIRESLAANSKHVAMVATANQGPQLISRTTTGGSATSVNGTAGAFTATWVRLVRVGSQVTASRSVDGLSWTTVGTVTVSMAATVYVGLLSSANSNTVLNEARFTDVSLTGTLNAAETVNGLAAPTGVAVRQGGGASLVVSWQAVTGADGYAIERSANGVDYTTVFTAAAADRSWTNTGLAGAMRYFYRVRATSGSSRSAASAIVSAVNRPSPVTDAAVTSLSNSQLVLNWIETTGETGYRIEQSPDNVTFTQIATVGANVPSYTSSGLAAGTPYWFRITPMTATGDGNPVVITGSTTGFQAVVDLAFTSKSSSAIGIEWTAVAGATGYRIERSGNGTGFTTLATVAAGTLAHSDTTVAPLGEFYYRVVALNGTIEASPSATIFTAAPAAVALPAPWIAVDVGSVAGAGATGWQSPKFVSVSSGTAIGGAADSFRFTYQPLVGDGSIVARVDALENTGAWAKAGVVIRESTATDARQAVMVVSATNGIAWQYRQNVGGSGVVVAGPTTQAAPAWVRVVRAGNTFTGSWSADGITWTSVGSITISMGSSVLAGLASTSDAATLLNRAEFSNVAVSSVASGLQAVGDLAFTSKSSSAIGIAWSAVTGASGYRIERSTNGTTFTALATVTGGAVTYSDTTVAVLGKYYYRVVALNDTVEANPSATIFTAAPAAVALPAPWTAADVGSVAGQGATGLQSGTFILVSSGTAIGGVADSFRFTSQTLVGDGSIVARVSKLDNTGAWAKAGVVIRESTATDARQAVMVVSATNGIAWQYRQNVGGSGVVVAGPTTQAAPAWVRVVRAGNTFTGSWSADGIAWTSVGSITISMGSSVLAGLASTSDAATLLNRAEFTNVAVSSVAPTVAATGAFSAMSTLLGEASAAQALVVTGSGLTAAVIATAPAGFDVSADGVTFGATAQFVPAGGVVSGTLSVRLAASAAVGSHSGNVTLASTGATGVSVPISASTVTDELVFDIAAGQTATHSVNRSGAIKVVKRGAGTLIVDAASGHSGLTSVEAGTLIVAHGDALATSAVRVAAGGTLKVNGGVTMRAPSVTVAGGTLDGTGATLLVDATTGIGTLAITSGAVMGSPQLTVSGNGVVTLPADRRQVVDLSRLTIDQIGGGRIDIGKGRINVAAGGTTETDLRADVVAGRRFGAFDGASGIMTTGGKASPTSQNPVVGYRIQSSGAAIVAWAAYGDTNLDGKVDPTDISLINQAGRFANGNNVGATWYQGDFNYSGGVNTTDIGFFNTAALFAKGSYLPVAAAMSMSSASGTPVIAREVWIAFALEADSQTKKR